MSGYHVHPVQPLVTYLDEPKPEAVQTYICNGTLDRDGKCVEYERRLRRLEHEAAVRRMPS